MRRPAMLSRDSDLTGYWSGAYWYDAGGGQTPFSAHIEDAGGRIAGSTLEPATFTVGGPSELSADISGARSGATVVFTKIYHAVRGETFDPIRYSGVTDDKFTRIEGVWRLPGLTGGFVMHRASFGAKAEVKRTAEVILFRR